MLFALSASASTWYVRPAVYTNWSESSPYHPIAQTGIYGSQNGTSYADAWNGIQSVVWGGGGVVSGDTLYICGSHLYWTSNNSVPYYQAYIAVSPLASGCTIRMDYATDPGQMFGGCLDYRSQYPVNWEGPDGNGVYRTTNYLAQYRYYNYQIDGTNWTHLTSTNVATWVGGAGYFSRVGNTNYVKMLDGSVPTTNTLALNEIGWTLAVEPGLSNVTFIGCKFIASSFYILMPSYPIEGVTLNCGPNHLTFRNCLWRDGGQLLEWRKRIIPLEPGEDYWTFDSCEFYNGPAAIYSAMGNQSGTNQNRGVVGLVVTNCYIHDIDTLNYPSSDGHAVGTQGSCDAVIVNNRIERTGQAIALWHAGVQMTNNLIMGNSISDVHWYNSGTTAGGVGIWISAQDLNTTTGNRIIGNTVFNCGIPGPGDFETWMGRGISYSGADYIEIQNNMVSNAYVGIEIACVAHPPIGSIVYNTVCHVTNSLIRVGNVAGGTVICDYNRFSTNTLVPATPFYFAGGLSHDEHSTYADCGCSVHATSVTVGDLRSAP